jgi:hypothetical protein
MNMKQILIILCNLISILPGYGQVTWFPTGAKWHYEFSSMLGAGLTTLEVLNEDTLIGNHIYKKIFSTTMVGLTPGSIDTFIEYLYVFEENQSVLGYDKFLGGTFLYDFNASVGDTLPMYFGGLSPYPFVVDSIGVMELNGSLLTFQVIRFPHPYLPGEFLDMKVVEGIGSINSHLFHGRTVIQPLDFPFFYFRCYEDATIGLVNLSQNHVDCDYIEGITSAEFVLNEEPKLFPNPTTDFVSLKVKGPLPEKIFVTDIFGAVRIVQSSAHQEIFRLDLRHLENGLFLILGHDENGVILFAEKVVKCGN